MENESMKTPFWRIWKSLSGKIDKLVPIGGMSFVFSVRLGLKYLDLNAVLIALETEVSSLRFSENLREGKEREKRI